MGDPHAFLSLAEASKLIQTRRVSPLELTQECLARIERLNPRLKAFITVTAETALQQARAAEAEIQRGEWRGPLHGIPLALKDLVETAGIKTTAASAVLKDSVPQQDAEVVSRLKAAGAVLLGKLNLHEFAYGGSGVIGHFGASRNPWNTEHITGGSSSGSAAAVAAGLCYGAIGTDTAGSIRLPAAFCGITGLKPTTGLVSARGVIPLSWSLDHVGPMTRSALDAALMLQVIAHYDPADINSRKFPPVHYPSAIEEDVQQVRLGIPAAFWEKVNAEIEAAAKKAVAVLAEIARKPADIDLSAEADRTVVRCEAFVFHQRFLPQHEGEYHPETLRRIRSGADVAVADFIHKSHELQGGRREILKLFSNVDVIVTPTSPTLPPAAAPLEPVPPELRSLELTMLRNTRPFNNLGLPAISIPCGFSKDGLPIGLQMAAAPGMEGQLLALAHAYQKKTTWHTALPPNLD